MRIALFVLLALPCVLPASAEILIGAARIIDADTVEIAGEKLRLEGIDAPESRQTCKRDGKRYDCGKEATAVLGRLEHPSSVVAHRHRRGLPVLAQRVS